MIAGFNKINDYTRDILSISSISLKAPIFIWGAPRSGTYLLYDILSLSNGIKFFATEFERRKKGIWGSLHHGSNVSDDLRTHPKPVEGFPHVWVSAGAKEIVEEGDTSFSTNIDARRVRGNYQALHKAPFWHRNNEEFRILDKGPQYLLMVDIIDNIFPDARHVFCLRDPRHVANSMLRIIRFSERNIASSTWDAGLFGNVFPKNYKTMIGKNQVEVACWQAARLIELGHSIYQRAQGRVELFYYEHLFGNFNGRIEELTTSLGLSFPQEMYSVAQKHIVSTAPAMPSNDQSRDASFTLPYSSDERRHLSELDELAVTLGYARDMPGTLVST